MAVLMMVATLSGCVALVAAGAAGGTVAYLRGELQINLDYPSNHVRSAALGAIQDLGHVLVADETDGKMLRITARTTQDERVLIHVDPLKDRVSRLRIRIGRLGSEEESRVVLDKILARL